MFMCFFVYFMVYSSYSNSATHGLDTPTWARVWVDCKDMNKDMIEQLTYFRMQVHTEFHFFDMNMVCVHS